MTPTTQQHTHSGSKSASVICLLAGIWLFLSPWIYAASSLPSAWNSWIFGALIVILAAIRLGYSDMSWISWINCLFGIWAFVSPWVYGYTNSQGRFINSLCVGVIVFIAALSAIGTSHQHPLPTHN